MKFKFDLQLFADGDTTDSTATPATDIPAISTVADNNNTVIQTDTEKAITAVEAALSALQTGTGDLITAEITGLEATLANLKTQAEAEALALETEAKTEIAKAEVAEKTFVDKYGTAICHGAEIILLAYIAGRLANLF